MQIWRKITDNWKFEKRCNYQGARQVAWYTEADWGVGGKSEKLYFLINGVGRQSLRFGGVSAQTQPWGSRGGGSANSRPSIEGENSHQYTCTSILVPIHWYQFTSVPVLAMLPAAHPDDPLRGKFEGNETQQGSPQRPGGRSARP